MAGNLTKRILFAVVAIPATLGVLWLGGAYLAAVIAVLGILGAREVYDLARRQGIEPLAGLGYLAAILIPSLWVTFWFLEVPHAAAVVGIGLTFWVLALLVAAMSRGPQRRPLTAVSVTCFGALYASLPLTFLLVIRHPPLRGHTSTSLVALVLFPLVLTWICDTFAYMVGSKIGGAKMAPILSPNKTWSGAVGGGVAAIVTAALLGQVLNRMGWMITLSQLLILGAAIGVLAQVGDVAESLLKREAGVKDSSSLIPGHGGVLDRLDSLYFVIPASAALYHLYGTI